MSKHFFSIIILFISSLALSNAQSFEYGIGLQAATVRNLDENQDPIPGEWDAARAFDFMIGGNFPIINFAKELSLNSYSQLHTALFSSLEDGYSFSPLLSIHIPTFITLNYGAGSNKRSILPFGLGAGLGYSFTGYFGDIDESYQDSEFFLSYFAPVFIFELAFDFGRSEKYFDNVKICFEKNLIPTYYQYIDQESNSIVEQSFSQFNLSFIFFKDHR
ncbi:hypothetical protein SAMN05661096_03371 [Marivirga sericea]|uniref:Outer membrane protein beta-barrel domain-containing protein n=1 Tax=Marivirga sericea TaxID=1028 RepID=A0A1X7L283_9BACT|nr:hypothetical protein [Marivirga sericea]SMG47322.1 hypothetical protein SAMN05661096_03371 [Marivirga sericea]